MGTKSALPVINEAAAACGQVTRREMVRRLLAAAGAGTAWPLVAASHPIHELLRMRRFSRKRRTWRPRIGGRCSERAAR